MTRRLPPSMPAIAAATESCHISTISAGTPGRQITRQGGRPSRGTSRSMPGAVPCGLGTTRLPAGNIAWISFCGGIGRPRRANIARMCSKRRRSSCSGRPVAWASASRVRSSAVGPSPPVASTTSARPIAWRKTSALGSNSSPTVVW